MIKAIFAYAATGSVFMLFVRAVQKSEDRLPVPGSIVLGAIIGVPCLIFGLMLAAARELEE